MIFSDKLQRSIDSELHYIAITFFNYNDCFSVYRMLQPTMVESIMYGSNEKWIIIISIYE
jgi:hypothetical protein